MLEDLLDMDVDWKAIGKQYAEGAGENLLTYTRDFVQTTDFGIYTTILRSIVPAVLDKIEELV